MNRRQFGGAVLASLVGISAGARPSPAAPAAKPKVKWQKSLRTAYDLAVEQDKPLLLVFGASWCTFCHKLQRETLSDPALAAMINREFVAISLDFDKDIKVVEVLEVENLPCTIVLSPQADLLLKDVGFAKVKDYQQKLESALAKQEEIRLAKGTESRPTRK